MSQEKLSFRLESDDLAVKLAHTPNSKSAICAFKEA